MNILFFIPARKNSKGIKNKNLSLINSKPLILYTLNFLKKFIKKKINKSDHYHYLISSDSKNIRDFCKQKGFNVDYKRPKKVSKDNSSMVETIKHGLLWYEKKNKIQIDTIIVLQPTSPLRYFDELKKMLFRFKRNNIQSMISVTCMKEHPFESIYKKGKNWKFLEKSKKNVNGRQDYDNNYFFIDGSYYIINKKFLLDKNRIIIENKTDLYLLDRTWPIDIDVNDDLKIAEYFLSN